jgi:hypothetical protein
MKTLMIVLIGLALGVGIGTANIGAAPARTVKAPKACVNAIGDARQVFSVSEAATQTSEDALRAMAPYPNMVKQAALAGANSDLAEIHRLVAQINSINGRICPVNTPLEHALNRREHRRVNPKVEVEGRSLGDRSPHEGTRSRSGRR